MTKKVTKQEYQKALGVVKSYAKQESKVLAHKTKKHATKTFGKFKSLFKK
jgi:ribosomal protein S2